jgi:hypothetical protein
VKSIQVKHSGESGREHRERARYCELGREGENRDAERKWRYIFCSKNTGLHHKYREKSFVTLIFVAKKDPSFCNWPYNPF